MVPAKDTDGKSRCFGNNNPAYAEYHDSEWGIPVHDDRVLYEFLILEGAQAGLSWETILNKRSGYQQSFHNFEVDKVAAMSDAELESLLDNPGIVRNRLKVFSARKNALAFIKIQQEFGSFNDYLWGFVDHTPIKNHWENFSDVPVSTPISDALSKDLKKRGMSFVGSTIMYAYMQAVGMVDDHLTTCWCYQQ